MESSRDEIWNSNVTSFFWFCTFLKTIFFESQWYPYGAHFYKYLTFGQWYFFVTYYDSLHSFFVPSSSHFLVSESLLSVLFSALLLHLNQFEMSNLDLLVLNLLPVLFQRNWYVSLVFELLTEVFLLLILPRGFPVEGVFLWNHIDCEKFVRISTTVLENLDELELNWRNYLWKTLRAYQL